MLAVKYIKEGGRTHEAHELLRKGEKLAEGNDHGRAMTYNNLACYYR